VFIFYTFDYLCSICVEFRFEMFMCEGDGLMAHNQCFWVFPLGSLTGMTDVLNPIPPFNGWRDSILISFK